LFCELVRTTDMIKMTVREEDGFQLQMILLDLMQQAINLPTGVNQRCNTGFFAPDQ
jgi:hypothetical protein